MRARTLHYGVPRLSLEEQKSPLPLGSALLTALRRKPSARCRRMARLDADILCLRDDGFCPRFQIHPEGRSKLVTPALTPCPKLRTHCQSLTSSTTRLKLALILTCYAGPRVQVPSSFEAGYPQ